MPFISGDEDGSFTNILIDTIARSSGFAYTQNHSGDYLLAVEIVENSSEIIGYRQSSERVNGENEQVLQPSERSAAIVIEVALYTADKSRVVIGPFQIREAVDYDFFNGESSEDVAFTDKEGKQQTLLQFSLGQLQPVFAATRAAKRPLYHRISKKIVSLLLLKRCEM